HLPSDTSPTLTLATGRNGQNQSVFDGCRLARDDGRGRCSRLVVAAAPQSCGTLRQFIHNGPFSPLGGTPWTASTPSRCWPLTSSCSARKAASACSLARAS